ncbi:hypothetical protein [Metabacillus halosaccharovorans]|uniref:hypothetical protein n=1 Tax=Metabacillus halosaccharovorans TaxID=930124 RepID=UPI001C1F893D|nr:hypothetical protein [Metabacillus halosaccharovorans]MBU7594541.1 hypothetical protein [Metabacillus halosaccharovorans]
MYRKLRGTLKHLYFALRNILPTSFFLKLSFRLMYLANLITVQNYIKKYKLTSLKDLPIDLKRSETVFILGSGSSINRITDSQWKQISTKDSIGFNFWLIHHFVPSLYVYEENLDKERNTIFYNILSLKKKDYKSTPLIVKDIEYKGISIEKIPNDLRSQVYVSTDLTVGCKREELELFYQKGYQFINSKNRNGLKAILKKSGTLSYLLVLAEQLNYKEIVLCGVDLNNSAYFYDEPKFQKSFSVPQNNLVTNQKHPTNQATGENVPIEDVIFVINELIFKPKGIKLYVGSKESALYPRLPYYFENHHS